MAINSGIRTGTHARIARHPVVELGWPAMSHAALGSLAIWHVWGGLWGKLWGKGSWHLGNRTSLGRAVSSRRWATLRPHKWLMEVSQKKGPTCLLLTVGENSGFRSSSASCILSA